MPRPKHTAAIRIWLATGLIALLSLGGLAIPSLAQPDTVKQIVPGVWFREGDLEGKGHCNNIVVEMKDYLIVVDANFPSGARAVMEDIKRISSKPVKYVFLTHHHADHAYGSPVWTKAGAITLAYVGVAEEMRRYEPQRWREASKERQDVGELNLPNPETPKQTFAETPFVLDDGRRRVEFHFFGWGHTRGDGFVYLPKEKLICTGDAALNGPYNYTGDANMRNWPRVLRSALKLEIVHVLPGHGGAGGKEILTGQVQFLEELCNAVQASIEAGKKLEDLVQMKGEKPDSASLSLPDSVKHWVGPWLAMQVKDAYEELSSGKPHGDLPH